MDKKDQSLTISSQITTCSKEQIQRKIEALPIAARVNWVKGHQDHHKLRSELSLEARVNCIADNVCTKMHHRHPRNVG
jgi:hypothetical protein